MCAATTTENTSRTDHSEKTLVWHKKRKHLQKKSLKVKTFSISLGKLEFSVLLKDTSTCGQMGNRTWNFPIERQSWLTWAHRREYIYIPRGKQRKSWGSPRAFLPPTVCDYDWKSEWVRSRSFLHSFGQQRSNLYSRNTKSCFTCESVHWFLDSFFVHLGSHGAS